MITLHILGNWVKITALAVVAIFLEHVFIDHLGWQILANAGTGLIYLLITSALFNEWRKQMGGAGNYRYSIIRTGNR